MTYILRMPLLYFRPKLDVNNEGPNVSTEQVTNSNTEQSMGTAYHGGQEQQQPISPSFYNYNAAQGSSYYNVPPRQLSSSNPYPMRMEQSFLGQQFSTAPSPYPHGTGATVGFPQYSSDPYKSVSPPPSYSSAARFNPVQRSPSMLNHNNSNEFFPRVQVAPTPYATSQLKQGYVFQKY
jgi:hypothetical protein